MTGPNSETRAGPISLSIVLALKLHCSGELRHEDDVRNLVEQTVARFGRLMLWSMLPALKVNLAG